MARFDKGGHGKIWQVVTRGTWEKLERFDKRGNGHSWEDLVKFEEGGMEEQDAHWSSRR